MVISDIQSRSYDKLPNDDFLNSDVDIYICRGCNQISLIKDGWVGHKESCISPVVKPAKMFGFVFAFLKASGK